MRNILILCLRVFLALIGGGVWWLTRPAHYGEPFHGVPRVGLAELSASPATWSGKEVRVSGVLVRQCPATGHWFYLRDEAGSQSPIKIEMDEANLPQRVGSQAIVEGRFQPAGDGWRIAASGIEFTKEKS